MRKVNPVYKREIKPIAGQLEKWYGKLYRDIWLIGVTTPLRISQLLNLRYDAIDFSTGRCYITCDRLDMEEEFGFVYIWFDGNNRKFYIGSHKGTPDDAYAHSSSQMESFTMNNIPKGFHRRILGMGTWEDMAKLEVELLMKCKAPLNEKYYNNSIILNGGRTPKHSDSTILLNDDAMEIVRERRNMYPEDRFLFQVHSNRAKLRPITRTSVSRALKEVGDHFGIKLNTESMRLTYLSIV